MFRFPAGALQGISALKIADCFFLREHGGDKRGRWTRASGSQLEAGRILICAPSIAREDNRAHEAVEAGG